MRTADRRDVRSYLDRIGTEPLLTAEQERALAARVAGGDAEARDRLVRANLRLVASLARRYAGLGVAGEDLMAEGNLGLMRAAEGYDGRVGARFATFAAYWIGQSMRRAVIGHGRAIRLPSHAMTLAAKWGRAWGVGWVARRPTRRWGRPWACPGGSRPRRWR
jgi:RNA polymerase primary sigma factor